MPFDLTEPARTQLLVSAREAIRSRLESRAPLYPGADENLKALFGAFVTLRIGSELRGCIGTMTGSEPLIDTVKEMAESSAFRDPRFPALSADELPLCTIEISILTPMKQIGSIEEIIVGEHGLYMSKGDKSGVLLPQVPIEQGWNRDEFLDYTCKKAGLPPLSWQNDNVDVFTFTAIIISE
ncbi:MAG: AmmeMemoRadiSam system protein A [Spirochaetales bacterium]|nr:AmmeMemoRadiSam system protein A [Spirochaetales bacterium]